VTDCHNTELVSLSAVVFSLDKVLDVSGEHFKSRFNSLICLKLVTLLSWFLWYYLMLNLEHSFLLYCFLFMQVGLKELIMICLKKRKY